MVDQDKPPASIQLLIMPLIHVSCAIDRQAVDEDRMLDISLQVLALHLNAAYLIAGAPYGEDEAGLREWLYERWSAPPVA